MKVGIVGSRGFSDLEQVRAYVRTLAPGTTVVSGGAAGVDSAAEEEARRLGLPVQIIKPEWARYGRRAGFLRNKDIVNAADRVVAFWDGKSRGTSHTIKLAEVANKLQSVVTVRR